MSEKNKAKCKGRRESIKEATPKWLTQEHKDMIQRLYDFAAELNRQEGKSKYHVDHIAPLNHPLACGLHVPWNLQILDEKDNKSKGNRLDTAPIKGAITIETLMEQGNMGIRYKGRYVKGTTGNEHGRRLELMKETPDLFTASLDDDDKFATTIRDLSTKYKSDQEFAEQAASLLIRSAKTPMELYRYLKDFMPYYQPKMGNTDKATEDREIVIKVLRPDEN